MTKHMFRTVIGKTGSKHRPWGVPEKKNQQSCFYCRVYALIQDLIEAVARFSRRRSPLDSFAKTVTIVHRRTTVPKRSARLRLCEMRKTVYLDSAVKEQGENRVVNLRFEMWKRSWWISLRCLIYVDWSLWFYSINSSKISRRIVTDNWWNCSWWYLCWRCSQKIFAGDTVVGWISHKKL